MSNTLFKRLITSALIFALGSCSHTMEQHGVNQKTLNINPFNQEQYKTAEIILNDFERSIAQRLMISLRYYCEQGLAGKVYCQMPLTKLPDLLSQMIIDTDLGGVVLFSENIESHKQVINLTNDLQQAALKSANAMPLFIGIDQEGGRVVRLKRNASTAFSGNMAIGATYNEHGVQYAAQVGNIIASELKALGINLNFSPDVDININPDNPVINVRSFGEDPQRVSQLGIAMMDAMQSLNVIATLKHFPGHGNTSIDSHTGLPSVNDDESALEQTDLVPFQTAINQTNPGMIMTAHIQYPNLDPSTIDNHQGEKIVKPATMSHKILTELLREKMGFKGVVITDALNMAGISQHFDLEDATAISLMAGADIALMPFRIREPLDINRFKHFVRKVAEQVLQYDDARRLALESQQRINNLHEQFNLTKQFYQAIDANQNIGKNMAHKIIEKNLAVDSITLLKNEVHALPLVSNNDNKIHIIIQDPQQLAVIKKAFYFNWPLSNSHKLLLTYTLLSEYNKDETNRKIKQADVSIVFYSERRESAVVKGEVGDLVIDSHQQQAIEQERLIALTSILREAKRENKKSIVVGMQSPYEMRQFMNDANVILVAYDASIYENSKTKEYVGVTYNASVKALLGINEINGVLPVSLNTKQGE